MKSLLKVAMGLLILSGAGMAMADDAMVQTNKPMVKTDVDTDTNVSANTKMSNGKTDVNETDSVELNKASVRENEVSIMGTRKDIDRDAQKLTDDTDALKDAQAKSDDKAIAQAKTDMASDKDAINKDRERLKKHLSEKIENDRVIVRKYDEKIRHTRQDVVRDSRKLSEATAKLADAQSRNAADDIEKAKADVATAQATVNEDTTKLNNRIAYKADCVADLRKDRRHLDAVNKNLTDNEQSSVSDDTTVNSQASAQ
jgi:hypothetical protein